MFKTYMTRVLAVPAFNLTAPLIMGLLVLTSGCSSDGEQRPEYLDATSVASLEIPPKLTSPDTSGALRLPKPSADAQDKFDASEDSTVIAPEFKGMRLKQQAGVYSLEIDAAVNDVWAMLPGFLAAEGIGIEQVEKLQGFVDTQWMNEYKVDDGNDSSWFKSFSPDYRDQFRIRVEAVNDSTTQMFVSHRGLQIVVQEGDDATHWQQRQSEAALEREILYRYMLYAGAGKDAATNILANYQSYQPRARIDAANEDRLTVMGSKQDVWLRLRIVMDRLGVDVVNIDESQSQLLVKVGNLDTVEAAPQQEDSGWFSGWFGGDVDVGDDGDYDSGEYDSGEYKKPTVKESEKITLKVRQIASARSSSIQVINQDGSVVKSGLGIEFRDALLHQLK